MGWSGDEGCKPQSLILMTMYRTHGDVEDSQHVTGGIIIVQGSYGTIGVLLVEGCL